MNDLSKFHDFRNDLLKINYVYWSTILFSASSLLIFQSVNMIKVGYFYLEKVKKNFNLSWLLAMCSYCCAELWDIRHCYTRLRSFFTTESILVFPKVSLWIKQKELFVRLYLIGQMIFLEGFLSFYMVKMKAIKM